jgi:hypothetical protein
VCNLARRILACQGFMGLADIITMNFSLFEQKLLSVDYASIVSILTIAIQEQQKVI